MSDGGLNFSHSDLGGNAYGRNRLGLGEETRQSVWASSSGGSSSRSRFLVQPSLKGPGLAAGFRDEQRERVREEGEVHRSFRG